MWVNTQTLQKGLYMLTLQRKQRPHTASGGFLVPRKKGKPARARELHKPSSPKANLRQLSARVNHLGKCPRPGVVEAGDLALLKKRSDRGRNPSVHEWSDLPVLRQS
jgi:hypothetical protein